MGGTSQGWFWKLARDRTILVFVGSAAVLGIITESIVLYGQAKEANIKAEIAANAPRLKEAEAAKTAAEAKVAAALAANARIRQQAEAKFATQRAIVDQATARYAERQKRAEADKLKADSEAAAEVAKNAEVKLLAEAQLAELQSEQAAADAAVQQWMTNCQQSRGGRGRDYLACAIKWKDARSN